MVCKLQELGPIPGPSASSVDPSACVERTSARMGISVGAIHTACLDSIYMHSHVYQCLKCPIRCMERASDPIITIFLFSSTAVSEGIVTPGLELIPSNCLSQPLFQISLNFPNFPQNIFYPLPQPFRGRCSSYLFNNRSGSGMVFTR